MARAADPAAAAPAAGFGADLAFLRKHAEVVLLSAEAGGAQVAVVPAWQGRVATSSAAGEAGTSFGWLNRALIASGKPLPHMTPYGGEDRLWIGPEGGQFSIFFKPGDAFDLAHWQTPAALDSEPFEVVSRDERRVSLARPLRFTNHSGTVLDVRAERTVRLLAEDGVRDTCGRAPAAGLKWVAFQSENKLTNSGRAPWTRKTGLLSVWILGMLVPSPATTIVIPHEPAAPGAPVVNDVYFGKVPADRLVVTPAAVFFRGDGQQRGKIGVGARHARAVLGSYDGERRVLTVVSYNKPRGPRPYVSSLWEIQKAPFDGDVVNAYNDGPPAPGAKPLGPFYELETSSPAAELRPGQSLEHVHRTLHFQGEPAALDAMARACLGVSLADIEGGLRRLARDPAAPPAR
jgi:hypothetical protein